MSLAALILPIALLQGVATPTVTADAPGSTHFQQCVTMIDADPAQAYEEGMAWAGLTHELGGYRCAAMALIAQNRHEEGARRLQSLATSINPEATAMRADPAPTLRLALFHTQF